MYSKLEKLLKRERISASALAREMGFSHTTFSDWRAGKSRPKLDKITLLCKRFNVPLDYFYEETQYLPFGFEDGLDIRATLRKEDKELLEQFKELSPEMQKHLLTQAKVLLDMQKREQGK